MNNYNDPQQPQHQQFMMNQQYGQFDQNPMQQQPGGMHPNMQMQHHPQRMPMDHQRPNFSQQIQRVPSQGTFQMNTGQPSQFQPNQPNAHQYLIRGPPQQQQQMPNMAMKSSQPQNASSGQMQQRMSGPPGPGMQQPPRLMHANYANSPQFSQPGGGSNVPMPSSMQGQRMDANSIIMQMPPQIRQQFDAETDHSRKGQIVQMFARKLQSQQQMQQQQQPQYNQFDQQNQMPQNQMSQNQMPPNQISQSSNTGMHPNMSAGSGQQRMPMDQQRSSFPPQQMQNTSSQNNFQISSNQPSHFQSASSGSQQYLNRNPPQQQQQQVHPSAAQPMQNVMKHSPMPQQPPSVTGAMPPQQRTGPPSVGNIPQPRSMHSNYANSPQPQSVQNVQNAAPTPRPSQTPAPAIIDTNDPEYKKLLSEMKNYQKETKILLERVRVDGHEALEKSLLRVLEIMEGKRDVDIKLMNKLLINLKSSIRQHNPLKTMYEFINRINTVPQNLDSPILPEGCWDRLEQFKIKVPANVLKHVEKVKEQEQSRKRKLSEEKALETDERESYCDVPCVDQTTRVSLPKELTDVLLDYNFSIDHNALPISEHVIYTQIIIQFNKPKEAETFKYSIPPLRLNVPLLGKSKPIQLVPFHEDDCSPMHVRIMDALKKSITDDSIMYSITSLINLWRKVIIQQVIPASDVETRKLISAT